MFATTAERVQVNTDCERSDASMERFASRGDINVDKTPSAILRAARR
jgi:hypothetical protein